MTKNNNSNPATDEPYIVSNVLRFHVPFIPLNKLSDADGNKIKWVGKLESEEIALGLAIVFIAAFSIFRLF